MVLEGRDFSALLVTWSNKYGAKVVDWQTEVAIDITGFPPHALNPSALGPLLERHCSIQAYGFNKAKGVCRVDGYALSTRSVPKTGELAFQYPTAHGVRNVVFPAALETYPYSEAPEFQPDGYPANPDHSIATFDTGTIHMPLPALSARLLFSCLVSLILTCLCLSVLAEELGYDREVLQEAYEEQHRGTILTHFTTSVH